MPQSLESSLDRVWIGLSQSDKFTLCGHCGASVLVIQEVDGAVLSVLKPAYCPSCGKVVDHAA